jgi:hypothetical protein
MELRSNSFLRLSGESLGSAVAAGMNALKQALAKLELSAAVIFLTGIFVGLLLPAREWPLILAVILAGIVFHRMIKFIDSRHPNWKAR